MISNATFKHVSDELLKTSTIYALIESHDKYIKHDLEHHYYTMVDLPRRQTINSAGYDFCFPYSDFTLRPGQAIAIETGISIIGLAPNEDLELHIRSGKGIMQRLRILNVVGIVDADFELSDNEGNITIAIINESKFDYTFELGERFAQGIIREHKLTKNDEPVDRKRNGGGSSTDV